MWIALRLCQRRVLEVVLDVPSRVQMKRALTALCALLLIPAVASARLYLHWVDRQDGITSWVVLLDHTPVATYPPPTPHAIPQKTRIYDITIDIPAQDGQEATLKSCTDPVTCSVESNIVTVGPTATPTALPLATATPSIVPPRILGVSS